ncbi:MAG: hypothetical protein ACLGH3_05010 [Actinomycetota bacterium]
MKRLIALAALAPMMMLPVAVQAQEDPPLYQADGTILVGNPLTRETGGVAEIGESCGESIDPDIPTGTFDGTDGRWLFLGDDPTDLWGHRATLTANRTIPDTPAPVGTGNDVDAWFYDTGCGLIRPVDDPNAYHMATVGSNEQGIIPQGAQWVVVDLYRGVAAEFEFTIWSD